MKNKDIAKIIIFLLIVVGAILIGNVFGVEKYIRGFAEGKIIFADNKVVVACFYVICTVLSCVLLALPGITFAILAGIMFGPYWGTLLCLISCTIGACVAFLVGRFFLKDGLKPKLEKNKLLKRFIFSENKNSDTVILMVTRLVPLFPFNIQNFAYGITDISFWKYGILTFVFMIPGVSIYTFLAAGFVSVKNKFVYMGVASALFAVVTLVGIVLKNKYVKD